MNSHIDTLTLQLFLAAVEYKSIAKAAERSHIAASAVSRRISDLEETLHVRLFVRNSKGIELTPAGYALLEHAQVVIGDLFQLEMELTGYSYGTRGHIRLFANRSAILETLPDELSAFLVANPLVRVDLEESISPDTIRAVTENRADIGIFGGTMQAPQLEVFPYRTDDLVVVVPAGDSLAGRASVGFAEIVEHDFIGVEPGSSIDRLCVRAAADLGRQLKVRIRVTGFDAMLRLVEARLGIGIAPVGIVNWRASGGRLACVPLAEPWAPRPLVIGIRDLRALPSAARLLVERLRVAG